MSSPSEPSPASLDPLLTRTIAGNFRIEKLIGSGAMGNVYKAEQLSLGKAVAVKVLHAHLMSDDKLVLRFRREAKSASLLNHPNSIQIIDSGQDRDGTLYIAMELLTGRDLAHVIRDDFPMSVPRIVRIMSQVLAALDEAHVQGVIHRDLKPSNIMLIERRGEIDFVKVCDFGIAKAAQDAKEDRESMLTIQGLVCGTPEYMAPEQARGETLDGRADLYAAAVILFQMVTGDIPFKGDTPMAIVSRHLVEAPAVPSGRRGDGFIPAALDQLILKGMEKNRELRFANAAGFREALEAVLTGADNRASSASDLRAQMPTTRISGTGLPGSLPGTSPSSDPANHFGATTQIHRRSRKLPLVAGFAVVLAVVAVLVLRLQQVESGATSTRERSRATTAALAVPGATAAGMLAAAPAPAAPQPHPEPQPESQPQPQEAPQPASTPIPPATAASKPAHRRKGGDRPTAGAGAPHEQPAGATTATATAVATTASNTPGASNVAPTTPGVSASVANPNLADTAPAVRGAREVIIEGEKLLGQGEVRDACARGEEAKRMNPRLGPIYKFLGKCYMRAGNASLASDNYKKYLELSPNASDAMFIKSIIK